MKKLITGIGIATVIGAFGTAGALAHPSHTDVALTSGSGSDWVFSATDPGATAELVQSPARSQLEWVVPGSFHNSVTDQTLDGTLFIRPTGGELMQPDFQFDVHDPGSPVTDRLPMFAYGPPTGSGYGVGAYFYSDHGTHDYNGAANGMFITDPANNTGIETGRSGAWLLGPAPYYNALTGNDALDTFGPKVLPGDGSVPMHFGDTTWTVTPGDDASSVLYQNMPIWHWDGATFTDGSGDLLTGELFLNSNGLNTYTMEFVDGKDLYAATQLGFGFTNFYSDVDGHTTDTLQTWFGPMDMTWLSWLFTPPDYSSAPDGDAALNDLIAHNSDILGNTIQFGADSGSSVIDHSTDVVSGAAEALSGGL